MSREQHRKDSEYHLVLQQLKTGHVAPFEDDDIFQNVEQTGVFPHISIVTGSKNLPGPEQLKALPKGSVVLDCGAFIGDNSSEFVSYGWTVFAFEPFLDSYICLCRNSPKSINVMAALGDGEQVVLNYDCPGTNHGMRSVKIDPSGVPTIRIDELPIHPVNFIKIDCEGHELFVLRGARCTIRNYRPYLYIECFPELMSKNRHTADMLKDLIMDFGVDYEIVELGSPPRTDLFCFPKP